MLNPSNRNYHLTKPGAAALLFVLSATLAPSIRGQASAPRLGMDAEAPPQRLALLIGNSQYTNFNHLQNPPNDVNALAAKLSNLGFKSTVKHDLSRQDMVNALVDFQLQIAPGDIALFYYSGHGIQVQGTNYLIPIDMPKPSSNLTIQTSGIDLPTVRSAIAASKLSFIILDACRTISNLPTKGPSPGLAAMTARGSLIAFAADEGQTASDNDAEGNSLFTKFLMAELDKPDVLLCELFTAIRTDVDGASAHAQFPFIYDGIIGDFVFNKQTNQEVTKLNTLATTSSPEQIYKSLEAKQTPSGLAAFIARFPTSSSTSSAKALLSNLMSSTTKAAGNAPIEANSESPTLNSLAMTADRLYKENAYPQALTAYNQLIAAKPSDPWISYNRANTLLQLHQYDDAIKGFDQAIQLKPDYAWAYYNRGVARHLAGDMKGAIADYTIALNMMPTYAAGYNNRSIAERESGDLVSAEKDARKAIELDPNYAPAYFNASVVYEKNHKADKAREVLAEANNLTIPKKP